MGQSRRGCRGTTRGSRTLYSVIVQNEVLKRCRVSPRHTVPPVSKILKVFLSTLLIAPSSLVAQNGRIVGTITDAASKAPLSGVQVSVLTTTLGAQSGADGSFAIDSVAAGTYAVRVHRLGMMPQTLSGVIVNAGSDTRVDVALERAPLELAGVVVSASRRVEKITDAPATITRIDARQIENTVGN
jgi:outer membrane receptor for ferrienterochelin and colicins